VKLDTKVQFIEKVPLCTDKETFIAWKEMARSMPPPPRVGFCADCNLDFQIARKAEKRCENPWIVFERDEDGFECGTLPREAA